MADLGISVFGMGAKATVNPGVEQALWNKEGDLLFDDTWLGLQLRLEGTPAFVRAGPELRFSPAAILEVNAHALGTSYFGNFTSLVGFDHPEADYGSEALQVAAAAGRQDTGRSTDLGFDVTLNGQYGPVVLSVTGEWSQWTFLPPVGLGQDFYYEPELAMLLAQEGEIVQRLDGALLLELHKDPDEDEVVYVGSYTSYGRTEKAGDRILRTGAAFVWQLDSQWTWYVLAQSTVIDRVFAPFPPFLGTQIEWEL